MGYNPSYKCINPTYPIYNWGYNPLTKWDEPPSSYIWLVLQLIGGFNPLKNISQIGSSSQTVNMKST